FNSTLSTTEKIAVFAPIATARVRMTTKVSARVLSRLRIATRTSCRMLHENIALLAPRSAPTRRRGGVQKRVAPARRKGCANNAAWLRSTEPDVDRLLVSQYRYRIEP